MQKCPKCGNEVEKEDKFCFACGAKLVKPEEELASRETSITKEKADIESEGDADSQQVKETPTEPEEQLVEASQEERPSEESPTPQKPPYTPDTERTSGKTGGGNKLLVAVLICIVFLIGWSVSGTVPKQKYLQLESQNEASKVENQSLKADLDEMSTNYSRLEQDYEAVSAELAQIREVYPPREFNSYQELTEWLRTNPVSDEGQKEYAEDTYEQALRIQEDALKDGYIVSATCVYDEETELYTILSETVINGHMFWWYPDEDIAYEDPYLGFISR